MANNGIIRKVLAVSIIGGMTALFAQSALAQDYYPAGFYLMAGGGYSYLDSRDLNLKPTTSGKSLSHDTFSGSAGAGTVGMGFSLPARVPLRLELNYVLRSNVHYNHNPVIQSEDAPEKMKSKIKTQNAIVALYYDFHINKRSDYIVPYIGAGAGFARNRVEMDITPSAGGTATSVKKTSSSFAWQVGVGVRFKLTNNVMFDLGARHTYLGKLQWGPWQGDSNWKITTDDLTAEEGFLMVDIFFGDQTPQRIPSLMDSNVVS